MRCDTSKEKDNNMKQSQFAEWREWMIEPTQKHIWNVSSEEYWHLSCFYFQIINYHLVEEKELRMCKHVWECGGFLSRYDFGLLASPNLFAWFKVNLCSNSTKRKHF